MMASSLNGNIIGGFEKSSVCKAREQGNAEAYFSYVRNFFAKRNAVDGLFAEPSGVKDEA